MACILTDEPLFLKQSNFYETENSSSLVVREPTTSRLHAEYYVFFVLSEIISVHQGLILQQTTPTPVINSMTEEIASR